MKNSESLPYLLRVLAVSNRLLVIIFKKYVAEPTIWDIFDYMPLDMELPTPPIQLPPHHFQNLQVQLSQQHHKIFRLN